MTDISHLDKQISEALGRLRDALAARESAAAPTSSETDLRDQLDGLAAENRRLSDELEQLRAKRDKDVAALDELITQLKPLIAEA